MADRKKMSVAEILAAARARKAGGAAEGDAEAAAVVGEPPAPAGPEATPASDTASKPNPALEPAVGQGGGRPSVAEIMNMARQKSSGETPAAEKPAAPAASASAQPQVQALREGKARTASAPEANPPPWGEDGPSS